MHVIIFILGSFGLPDMLIDGKITAQGHRTFYSPHLINNFRTTNFILQHTKPARNH